MTPIDVYIEKKMRTSEKLLAWHQNVVTPSSWRMRLRVRFTNRLNNDQNKIKSEFFGRRIIIRSAKKDSPLKDSEWVLMEAGRFKNIESAAKFGFNLQRALSVIAALYSIPIDVGFDNATISYSGDIVKEAVAKHDVWLLDEVHGVDVFPSAMKVAMLSVKAEVYASLNESAVLNTLSVDGKKYFDWTIKPRRLPCL